MKGLNIPTYEKLVKRDEIIANWINTESSFNQFDKYKKQNTLTNKRERPLLSGAGTFLGW